jgi:hypothetical protein
VRWLLILGGALATALALRRATVSSIEIWSGDLERRLFLPISSRADLAVAADVARLLREQA